MLFLSATERRWQPTIFLQLCHLLLCCLSLLELLGLARFRACLHRSDVLDVLLWTKFLEEAISLGNK
jgi:hypothetical protein